MARQGGNKKRCERYKSGNRYEHNKRKNLMKFIKKVRKVRNDPKWLPKLKPVPAWARDILK